jgi:hypothetical protein
MISLFQDKSRQDCKIASNYTIVTIKKHDLKQSFKKGESTSGVELYAF